MPPHSRLARLQQVTTLGAAALAVLWAVHWAPRSPWVAALGALLLVGWQAVVLALEFVIVGFVHGTDPAPRPGWGQLALAWAGEVVHATRVFGWRQPFRWRAEPDRLGPEAQGRRGMVLVHGFVCNRGFWTPWLRRLREGGHAFEAVNLEPVFGTIDGYARIVEGAVQRVTAATGLPPVIVGHSMGGLAIRAWMRAPGAGARVHRAVTIGTPHQGTWLGRFGHSESGRQMRLDSPWLADLAGHPDAAHDRFTCWYSNCDNIVFPCSTATLAGADNRFVPGVAHVALAFHPDVVESTFGLLRPPA